MDRRTPGLPVLHHLWSLLRLTSIESVMPSKHLVLQRSLLLLPSNFPGIRVFSNESAFHIRWPKYWNFSGGSTDWLARQRRRRQGAEQRWRSAGTVDSVVVQSLSHVQLIATPWAAARQASLSFTISWNLLKLESVTLSNHLIYCHPFLLLPSSFPSIRVFPVSWLFPLGGQSFGASASVLPMNIQGWFPLGLTGLIFLQSKGLSRVFPSTTIWKHEIFSFQPSLWSNSHIHMWFLEKLWLYRPLQKSDVSAL